MKIIIWPDPRLKQVSAALPEAESDMPGQDLLKELYDTMKAAGGVGLSAIQVGIAKRIVVADLGQGLEVYVNPVINGYRGEAAPIQEGCLSTPGQFESVSRYPEVVYFALRPGAGDLGTWYRCYGVATGLRAQMLQHELEHLDGKMYVDHLKAADRSRIRGNMMKLKRGNR